MYFSRRLLIKKKPVGCVISHNYTLSATTSMQKEQINVKVSIQDPDLTTNLQLKVPFQCKLTEEQWVVDAKQQLANKFEIPKEQIQLEWHFIPSKSLKELLLSDCANSGHQYVLVAKVAGIVDSRMKDLKTKLAEELTNSSALKNRKY